MAQVDAPALGQQFYDQRYRDGYMDQWPEAKKARVAALIRALPLPTEGRALDFGCGQGVFTEVLRDALPNWQVFGSELSEVALDLARARVHGCRFVGAGELEAAAPFNLVFTHHVLEHVADLNDTMATMAALVTPDGAMFHIMPCGNEGSFEQRLSTWRNDGVDPEIGNRFFFEDEGHLRRITSDELVAAAAPFGFTSQGAWFANHFWGAVDWITDLDRSFVWSVTNPWQGNSLGAKARLLLAMVSLVGIQLGKRPPKGMGRSLASRIQRLVAAKRDAEWHERQKERSGSEMYIFLARRGAIQ